MADTQLWKANTVRYFEEMQDFPPQVVAKALEGAWRQHPEFFPGLGQMHALCSVKVKEAAHLIPASTEPDVEEPINHEAVAKAKEQFAKAVGGIGS